MPAARYANDNVSGRYFLLGAVSQIAENFLTAVAVAILPKNQQPTTNNQQPTDG